MTGTTTDMERKGDKAIGKHPPGRHSTKMTPIANFPYKSILAPEDTSYCPGSETVPSLPLSSHRTPLPTKLLGEKEQQFLNDISGSGRASAGVAVNSYLA